MKKEPEASSLAPFFVQNHTKYSVSLVYKITKKDGSGYNRKNGVQLNTKSKKVGGAITNAKYRS
jgi:hypothetical protein